MSDDEPIDEDEPIIEEAATATVLLAVAAVLASVIAGRASLLTSNGSDIWHKAVRDQVKQTAAVVEDVRYLYEVEAPIALRILEAELRAEEYAREARRAPAGVAEALRVEAEAYSEIARLTTQASDIVPNEKYHLPAGGYDLVERLADLRRRNPELVAIDSAATEAQGSELVEKSTLVLVGIVPVAVAFLLGALVQGFPARRRVLVITGSVFLLMALTWSVGVEVTV